MPYARDKVQEKILIVSNVIYKGNGSDIHNKLFSTGN